MYKEKVISSHIGLILQKQKSFDELRKELEKQNPILHIELKATDENYNFDTCEKFPLEKLLVKNTDELPFGVDPSHREVKIVIIFLITIMQIRVVSQ